MRARSELKSWAMGVWAVSGVVSAVLTLGACSDDDEGGDPPGDAGADTADSGLSSPPTDGGRDDAGTPRFGGLEPTVPQASFELDLFGTVGHRIWVQVSDAELKRINEAGGGGGFPPFLQNPADFEAGSDMVQDLPAFFREAELDANGDIYSPGAQPTFADHVLVEDVSNGATTDFGKVEVKLVGESTYRAWSSTTIPNVRFDFDEFQMGVKLGGFEHLRLNNSLVGTIFREALAHRVYRALGYPALRASHALLGSNVWGQDVWVPMTLIEVYKPRFCADNQESIGGACKNMWEFQGDPGEGVPVGACQWAECDDARLVAFRDKLRRTPFGPGFQAATADFIDWPRMHQFQCLSFILATGDDALHNANNNLIMEREDGRLVWAPYSVDISAGQSWYPSVPLTGTSRVARGCQQDPVCWSETLSTCEALIEDFDALNPEALLETIADELMHAGMMRDGDVETAMELRHWYTQRQLELTADLERYRHLPDVYGVCPNALEVCMDGTCGSAEQCVERQCGMGQHWCPELNGCLPSNETCFSCDGEAAIFCPASNACEISVEVCSAQCAMQFGPDTVFCEPLHQCIPSWECEPVGAGDDAGVTL
jgi:hypothetical protein